MRFFAGHLPGSCQCPKMNLLGPSALALGGPQNQACEGPPVVEARSGAVRGVLVWAEVLADVAVHAPGQLFLGPPEKLFWGLLLGP